MFRHTLMLAALFTIGGCAASTQLNGGTPPEMTPTQRAAYAGATTYPTNLQAPGDLHIAAIVNKDKDTIKIYNFTDQPIRDAKLWVNRAFVTRIDIAPMSKAVIETDKLYDRLGNTFAKQKVEMSSVQIQNEGGLFDLLGPGTE